MYFNYFPNCEPARASAHLSTFDLITDHEDKFVCMSPATAEMRMRILQTLLCRTKNSSPLTISRCISGSRYMRVHPSLVDSIRDQRWWNVGHVQELAHVDECPDYWFRRFSERLTLMRTGNWIGISCSRGCVWHILRGRINGRICATCTRMCNEAITYTKTRLTNKPNGDVFNVNVYV